MDQDRIKNGVSEQILWWLDQRRSKFAELRYETMSINPFLLPLISAMHGFCNASQLAAFLVSAHLSTGYATGFGKLIDEKILPLVFGTVKLDKRNRNKFGLTSSVFDEIDHLVPNGEKGTFNLLSLKAGKWTIQLTMAVQLNAAFSKILQLKRDNVAPVKFNEIAVGVIYGTEETLTDKYRIVRGINRGAIHDVVDICADVHIYAGNKFWAWLNHGEEQTQQWVLEGILLGIDRGKKQIAEFACLLKKFEDKFASSFNEFIRKDGTVDWQRISDAVNEEN